MSSKSLQQTIHPDLVPAATLSPKTAGRSNWIPAGDTVTIHGLKISCGLFYMGSVLYNQDGHRVTNEPSIINPAKPVDRTGAPVSPYWYGSQTSYQAMQAGDRWRYLEWLASGRTTPTTPNIVTLFLAGLERRVLVDARYDPAAQAELPEIESELLRLLERHSAYMFYYQAKQFLLALRMTKGDLDGTPARPLAVEDGWEVPIEMKIALGGFAARGEPLPPRWALAWTRADPNIRLSTPAARCPKEFNQMFLQAYTDEYGEGIRLRNNKSRIQFHYTPSNRSLWGMVTLEAPNLPDVTRQRKATQALYLVAQLVARELDPYSRWVSSHQERTSLRAVSLLPAEIAGRRKSVKEFLYWAKQKLNGKLRVELPVREFVERWSYSATGNMTRREVEQLSEFLERFQYGFEPDIRFGGADPARLDALMLFRLPEAVKRTMRPRLEDFWQQATTPRNQTSDGYLPAQTLVRLGLVIALDKGTPSLAHIRLLEQCIARFRGLTANERARLTARLHWSLARPVDSKGLKPRCSDLASDELRKQYARFLVVLAGSEHRIGPDELKALEKVYKLLGLKHEEIARDVHLVATTVSEPVTIMPADADTASYSLPEERPDAPRAHVQLSAERVKSIVAETQRVGDVLGDVFAEDDATRDEPEVGAAADPGMSISTLDLDAAHSALAHRLAERTLWKRHEVEQLCAEFGLLTNGAIEALNDVAFELIAEPFLEGDDPIEVNTEFVAEFMHA